MGLTELWGTLSLQVYYKGLWEGYRGREDWGIRGVQLLHPTLQEVLPARLSFLLLMGTLLRRQQAQSIEGGMEKWSNHRLV